MERGYLGELALDALPISCFSGDDGKEFLRRAVTEKSGIYDFGFLSAQHI